MTTKPISGADKQWALEAAARLIGELVANARGQVRSNPFGDHDLESWEMFRDALLVMYREKGRLRTASMRARRKVRA